MSRKRSAEAKRAPPPSAIVRLAEKLFAGDQRRCEDFVMALERHDSGKSVAIAVRDSGTPSPRHSEAWMPDWVMIPHDIDVLGKSEAHAHGEWYVLDQSSVFCASPLLTLTGTVRAALDLCAAPGGKAVFLWRALKPLLLVANEPIQGRIRALISNIKRCAVDPCIIVRRDPARLVEEMRGFYSVVLVDAPCSGQSLRVKGKPSPGAFHHTTVNMCVRRQRRILSAASDLVEPGGAIVYSTCTFSREENEGVLEWFLKRNPRWTARVVPHLQEFQSHLSQAACYRLWPMQGYGAGGFTCLLQLDHDGSAQNDNRAEAQVPHIEWSSSLGADTAHRMCEEHLNG